MKSNREIPVRLAGWIALILTLSSQSTFAAEQKLSTLASILDTVWIVIAAILAGC